MTLYHTSPSEIKEIHEQGMFGSFLFFSSRIYYMNHSEDAVVYKCEIEDDKIIKASQLFYHEDAEKLDSIVEHVMNVLDVDRESAEDFLSQQESTGDGDNDWWVQRQTAECAKILGFVGVSMRDEQGTCYMLDAKQIELKLVD